ncbi:MAG: hypothetical protein H0V43_12705 [Gemmatimonadales bacterium]|nr:hypothetical protein [Gemmatimonadales bacterium]
MQLSSHAGEPLVLRIGDRLVEGWTATPDCPDCGGARVYFLAYDATCCPSCNRCWSCSARNRSASTVCAGRSGRSRRPSAYLIPRERSD